MQFQTLRSGRSVAHNSLPLLHASTNLTSQPGHWQVRGQQVKRDVPRRGGYHETRRQTTAKKDYANREGNLRLVACRDQVSSERANERTKCMGQERKYEMPRLKK